jgi:hypothetical protein
VQSEAQHSQFPALAAEPSVTEHIVFVLHLFSEDKQNNPVDAAVQSLVPQEQLAELEDEPSAVEHDAK